MNADVEELLKYNRDTERGCRAHQRQEYMGLQLPCAVCHRGETAMLYPAMGTGDGDGFLPPVQVMFVRSQDRGAWVPTPCIDRTCHQTLTERLIAAGLEGALAP